MDTRPAAAQSAQPNDLGVFCIHGPSSALTPKPKTGAQCVSSARRDLREGCRATGIPIAAIISIIYYYKISK